MGKVSDIIRRGSDFLLILSSAVLVILILAKAGICPLIYDESFTLYFFSSKLGMLTSFDFANNHPLNSTLIYIITNIAPHDEFFVRLPNILAGILYIYTTFCLIQTTRLKIFVFALCLLNVTLLDFFSLARGYGISAALVQYGLVEYYFLKRTRYPYLVMMASVALACYSIFSTVVFFYILLAVETLRRCIEAWTDSTVSPFPRIRRDIAVAAALGTAGLWPLFGLFSISQPGKPLYGAGGSFFDAVMLGIVRTYTGTDTPNGEPIVVSGLILIAVVVLLLLLLRKLSVRTLSLGAGCVTTYFVIFLFTSLTGKPMPTGRVLLPYFPMTVLSIISIFDDAVRVFDEKYRGRFLEISFRGGYQAASLLLLLNLFIVFRQQYDLRQANLVWPESKMFVQNILSETRKNNCLPEIFFFNRDNPAVDYYTEKFLGVPAHDFAQCPPP